MAKDKEEKTEKTERELRYEAFVAEYAKKNPKKYEEKKARGHFDQVPASFV